MPEKFPFYQQLSANNDDSLNNLDQVSELKRNKKVSDQITAVMNKLESQNYTGLLTNAKLVADRYLQLEKLCRKLPGKQSYSHDLRKKTERFIREKISTFNPVKNNLTFIDRVKILLINQFIKDIQQNTKIRGQSFFFRKINSGFSDLIYQTQQGLANKLGGAVDRRVLIVLNAVIKPVVIPEVASELSIPVRNLGQVKEKLLSGIDHTNNFQDDLTVLMATQTLIRISTGLNQTTTNSQVQDYIESLNMVQESIGNLSADKVEPVLISLERLRVVAYDRKNKFNKNNHYDQMFKQLLYEEDRATQQDLKYDRFSRSDKLEYFSSIVRQPVKKLVPEILIAAPEKVTVAGKKYELLDSRTQTEIINTQQDLDRRQLEMIYLLYTVAGEDLRSVTIIPEYDNLSDFKKAQQNSSLIKPSLNILYSNLQNFNQYLCNPINKTSFLKDKISLAKIPENYFADMNKALKHYSDTYYTHDTNIEYIKNLFRGERGEVNGAEMIKGYLKSLYQFLKQTPETGFDSYYSADKKNQCQEMIKDLWIYFEYNESDAPW